MTKRKTTFLSKKCEKYKMMDTNDEKKPHHELH
jgi:hypothetical protein